jgi:hypothetical protein
MSIIKVPLDFIEAVADVRLPPRADLRLQQLMDQNTNGQLNESERAELGSLAEISECLSLLRARALRLLGPKSA